MNRIQPVFIAVIQKGNHFLLTQRKDLDPEDINYHNHWQFPGGGIEFAESPEEAIKREIREEAGIEIEIISLLPKIFTEVRNRWQGLFICYLCKMKDESHPIVINDEAVGSGWYTLEEIRHLPCLPKTFEIAELAQSASRI